MPKQKSDTVPDRLNYNHAALSISYFEKEMRRHETAWLSGSIPALVDALIFCHEFGQPPPLWLVRGLIEPIKIHFEGKALAKPWRAKRFQTNQKDYARWEAVNDFAERRPELLKALDNPYGLLGQREKRPGLFALAQDNTLEQRCAAVSELFALTNDPAKGRPDTILRSYKKVQREMKKKGGALYYIPSSKNPLNRPCAPFS